MKSLHVKKGDEVKVLVGKDKGKTGVVLSSLPQKNRVVVEGVNIGKKHVRGQGIIDIARPIHVSNVKKVAKSEAKKS